MAGQLYIQVNLLSKPSNLTNSIIIITYIAAYIGDKEIVEIILQNESTDVDMKINNGFTPLYIGTKYLYKAYII